MNAADSDYKPGLDLVVVNYRTPGDLADFLASVVDAAIGVDFGLTVANVDPADGDRRVVKDWTRKLDLGYVEFKDNVGYATAINRGVARGEREVVVALNADVRIRTGVIDACHQALMGNDDWGVLGPRQVDSEGRFTHAGIFGTRSAPRHRGWKERDDGRLYRDVMDAVTVSGSAYFAKRAVWDELAACPTYKEVAPNAEGAFLPTQHYYEETWASYHAASHGYRVMYYGFETLVHEWHRASTIGGHADQQMTASRERFRRACDVHGIEHD
jgi:GT2 family glycosyltransferase